MKAMTTKLTTAEPVPYELLHEMGDVFDQAADLFAVLASPLRIKILHCCCTGERSVNELIELVGSSQPNVSQHLALMHRAGVLAKRKEGAQVFYRVANEQAAAVCRSVCTQIAIDSDEGGK
jgi:DNA-binding transcriptional ArsR family regulator